MDLELLKQDLIKSLSEKRYRHTLGVAETAVHLGRIYGEDVERLEIAAFLHDIAKSMTHGQQMSYIQENSIDLTEDDIQAKGTIHALIGERIARDRYGVSDPEILNAIRWHTCGHPDMERFQKIIFASDYLDPSRSYEDNIELLHLVETSFERGILDIIMLKITYVFKKKEYLHPLAVSFYNQQIKSVEH